MLPSKLLIEQTFTGIVETWNQVDSFLFGIISGDMIGIRRYECLLFGIETSANATITADALLSMTNSLIKRERYDTQIQGIVLYVGSQTKWNHIADAFPYGVTLLAEFSQSLWDHGMPAMSTIREDIVRSTDLRILNPFDWNRPCSDTMFFGRDALIREILTRPTSSFALVGPRRIGKTSLLYRLRKEFARFTGQTFVQINCSGIESKDKFYSTILSQISPRVHQGVNSYVTMDMLIEGLMRASSIHRTKFVIALDEFDVLVERGILNSGEARGIVNNAKLRGRCRFIVTGHSSLWHELSRPSSDYFNLFKDLEVGAFSKGDGERFVRVTLGELGINVASSHEAIQAILFYSGLLPWLIQAICNQIIEYSSEQFAEPLQLVDMAIKADDISELVLRLGLMGESPLGTLLLRLISENNDGIDLQGIHNNLATFNIRIPPETIVNDLSILRISGAVKRNGSHWEISCPLLASLMVKLWSVEGAIDNFMDSYAFRSRLTTEVEDNRIQAILRMQYVENQYNVHTSGQGIIINIAEYMVGVTNTVNQNISKASAPDEVKELVKKLSEQVAAAGPKIAETDPDAAVQMGSDVKTLSEELTQAKPRQKWYELSLSGLKEAAEAVGEIGKPIAETVIKLMPLLLPK